MKHGKVKEHIIETASKLFYNNGYNRTGVNEIIAEAEIAKATLYNHFKSKDDICLAFLRHMHGSFIQNLTSIFNEQDLSKKRLLVLFDFAASLFSSNTFNGCWCINTLAELPPNNVRIVQEIQRQKEELLSLIEVQTGLIMKSKRKAERLALARQIYVLYEGAIAESHLHQEEWPIVAAKSVCKKLLG